MGYGEVGGNGSVKWKFVHGDASGGGGKPKKLKCKNAGSPAADEVTVDYFAHGHDPIPFADIGTGIDSKGDQMQPGFFRVTLTGHGTFDVQAVDRTGGQNANIPMEIIIEW